MTNILKKFNSIKGQNGFTLVEIIAVLVIMALFATTAIARYSDIEDSARLRMLETSVLKLNEHVRHAWLNSKVMNGVGSYIFCGATLGADVTITNQEAGKEPATGYIYLNRDGMRYRLEWIPGLENGYGYFNMGERAD